MSDALTTQEARALAFIRRQLRATGVSPSIREIAVAIGLSPRSVSRAKIIIDGLIACGFLSAAPAQRARRLGLGYKMQPGFFRLVNQNEYSAPYLFRIS